MRRVASVSTVVASVSTVKAATMEVEGWVEAKKDGRPAPSSGGARCEATPSCSLGLAPTIAPAEPKGSMLHLAEFHIMYLCGISHKKSGRFRQKKPEELAARIPIREVKRCFSVTLELSSPELRPAGRCTAVAAAVARTAHVMARGAYSADEDPFVKAQAAATAHSVSAGDDGGRRKLTHQPTNWKFLTAIIWAPAFPAIRHMTARMEHYQRLRIVFAAIGVANLHAFWLINNPDLSDEALGIVR